MILVSDGNGGFCWQLLNLNPVAACGVQTIDPAAISASSNNTTVQNITGIPSFWQSLPSPDPWIQIDFGEVFNITISAPTAITAYVVPGTMTKPLAYRSTPRQTLGPASVVIAMQGAATK